MMHVPGTQQQVTTLSVTIEESSRSGRIIHSSSIHMSLLSWRKGALCADFRRWVYRLSSTGAGESDARRQGEWFETRYDAAVVEVVYARNIPVGHQRFRATCQNV